MLNVLSNIVTKSRADIIRDIAKEIESADKKSATIAANLFNLLADAINSNDSKVWGAAKKEIAEALGYKSLNQYRDAVGGSLYQRVSEFTWSVEGVEYALESYDDYLQAKADMAEAKKAAKDEPTDGDIAEALEATMTPKEDEAENVATVSVAAVESVNFYKQTLAMLSADNQNALAAEVSALIQQRAAELAAQ